MAASASTANPALPPIPQPVADAGALALVTAALKARVEAISAYLATLPSASAAKTGTTSAVSGYTLPVASASTLGGVRVDGIVTQVVDGVLKVPGVTSGTPVTAATTTPLVDALPASTGTSAAYAREDHSHPTDLSRYAASNPSNYTTADWVDMAIASAIAGGIPTYVFTQAVAASVWTILHALGRYPSVTVVDSSGNSVEGDVAYNSANQVTLTFSAVFSGTAYLN